MAGARYFERTGAVVALGPEIGRGGEGVVSQVQDRPNVVAKIYLARPDSALAAKLGAMAELSDTRLASVAAWPSKTLHSADGLVVGFLMPRVAAHRPVYQLYGPRLRLREFPTADWRFLVHAAANTARAFSVLHSRGLVLGDVNHGNLLVSQDATVTCIDCDSFQVEHNGRRWLCEVGVNTHQPPEMQGLANFKSVVRTPNHDAFGLAVLIFQMLCLGRHPFMGRYLGAGDPPMIEESIAAGRYAYSRDARRTSMAPPPGSLSLEALTPAVRDLFEAAFAPASVRGGRPDGTSWASALAELAGRLRQCGAQRSHYFLSSLGRCPWCALEAEAGAPLFPVVFVPGAAGAPAMAALWQQVSAIVPPRTLPLPDPRLSMPPPAAAMVALGRRTRNRRFIAGVLLALAALTTFALPIVGGLALIAVAFLAAVLCWRLGDSVVADARRELIAARQSWAALRSDWEAEPRPPSFSDVRRSLDEIKAKYDQLGPSKAARHATLLNGRRQAQWTEHLDRCYVASAKIPGVGQSKIATLQGAGIYTARDIEPLRIIGIPGFGPATTAKLLDWRKSCEARFRFDPNRGVAKADLDSVEREFVQAAAGLEHKMAAGLNHLRAIVATEAARCKTLEDRAREVVPRLAQATANARAALVK